MCWPARFPLIYYSPVSAHFAQVPYQRLNEIVNRRRGMTPSTALRLARYFETTPDLWMNLQLRWDLYEAQRKEEPVLRKIRKRRA